MSDNISKHLDNPTPNGSEDERDPPQDGNEGEDEASEGPPACLDSARCQLCHSQIRRLQEHAVERKKVYQTALQRRKDALTTKDAAFKALKTQLEAQRALAKTQVDAARQATYTKLKKVEADLQARLVTTEAELKRQAEDLKALTKLQVREIKSLQSELSDARLEAKKTESQSRSLLLKCATSENLVASLKKQILVKDKELQKKETQLQSTNKRLDRQLQLKLEASVEKERLKLKKEELLLKRDENRKRKTLELRDQEFEKKKALQSHRFECMSKVNSQKEAIKKKTHREKMDESASRLANAQALHHSAGTFPNIGGGDGSIQQASRWYSQQRQVAATPVPRVVYNTPVPPVFVQQTLTQMPATAPTSSSACQPYSPSPDSLSSPDDLLPQGWMRWIDPKDGSTVFIHRNGRQVKSRLDIYKTPPPLSP